LTQAIAKGKSLAASLRPHERLDSVDLLRGSVMVLMVLDHVREFFTDGRISPTDLSQASAALFLTRWVTHFCAPVFVFLAGTGAYLYGAGAKSRGQLARFLLIRGLWLIILELTVVKFSLLFTFAPGLIFAVILWAIGWSMIVLSALVLLPTWLVAALGVVMIATHNLADGVRPADLGSLGPLWVVLHQQGLVQLPMGARLLVAYPLIPWIGVMAAGYGFGALLGQERGRRRRQILMLGLVLTAAFVILRFVNNYGDPNPWQRERTPLLTALSFLNCTKYPPSLLFLLMTLGPAMVALSLFDRAEKPGRLGQTLVTLGRVPLFFFVLQFYVIHPFALVLAAARGQSIAWLFSSDGAPVVPPECVYPLPVVYLIWAIVVILLYYPCRWFAEVKRRRPSFWLSLL
jgi:uncharacterized membrane protein